MKWWRHVRTRHELDDQLDRELRDHVERLTADYVATGLAEGDAMSCQLRNKRSGSVV